MDPVLQDRCTEKCAYYVKELISISVKSINVNAAVWKEQANSYSSAMTSSCFHIHSNQRMAKL